MVWVFKEQITECVSWRLIFRSCCSGLFYASRISIGAKVVCHLQVHHIIKQYILNYYHVYANNTQIYLSFDASEKVANDFIHTLVEWYQGSDDGNNDCFYATFDSSVIKCILAGPIYANCTNYDVLMYLRWLYCRGEKFRFLLKSDILWPLIYRFWNWKQIFESDIGLLRYWMSKSGKSTTLATTFFYFLGALVEDLKTFKRMLAFS